MPVPFRQLSCLLSVTLLVAVAPVAMAQDPAVDSPPRGPEMRAALSRPESGRQRMQDSMTESVRRIERNTRGRVLSVEQLYSDGRNLNRVKVMDDSGRVRIYVDDPQQRRATQMRARGDDD